MAKVLFTAVVADMRGKLAGSVFSKNRGGAFVRTKVSPVNQRTASQQYARSNFGAASSAWRELAPDMQQSWRESTGLSVKTDAFGNVKRLSGQQLYVGICGNLRKIESGVILQYAPVPEGAGFQMDVESQILKGTITTGNVTSLMADLELVNPTNSHVRAYVRATAPLSLGINNPTGKFREIPVNGPADSDRVLPGEPAKDIKDAYESVFGTIMSTGPGGVQHGRIWLEVTPVNMNTGESGVPLIGSWAF